jgi:hypothetical protein
MGFGKCWFGAAVALAFGATAWGGTTTLDADGGIRFDGKRWFPLGIYELPADETGLARITDAGFNLVNSGLSASNMDRLAAKGLKAWAPIGGLAEVRDATGAKKLAEMAASLKDHPALAFWEFPDEALWNVGYLPRLAFDRERKEILELISARPAVAPDLPLLKSLYRELLAADAVRDLPKMEEKTGELWKVLGQPGRNAATPLSSVPQREGELFNHLMSGYMNLKAADPDHLIWQNHAPRNSRDLLARHAAYCDLIGCDIYPYPDYPGQGHTDLTDRTLSSVGAYTKRFSEIAPDKGILMVPQGFSWRALSGVDEEYAATEKGAPPTYLASRFMAYDAIARGANGLCYWGTHSSKPDDPVWKGLVPVVQELASLQDFLAEPEIPLPIRIEATSSWNSQDKPVVCSARKAGEDWFFLFVNELDAFQSVRVELPPQFDGKRLYFLYENLYVEPVADSYVPLPMPRYGVRILTTRNDLEVEDLRALNRLLEEPF